MTAGKFINTGVEQVSQTKELERSQRQVLLPSGSSLLIVDDSQVIVDRLTEIVEDSTNISDIKSCNTYTDALLTIATFRPAIVMLDINLGGRSGLDLLRYIKTYLTNTFVIMISNQSGDYYKELCRKLGADYFVDKAKDFCRISEILTECLSTL